MPRVMQRSQLSKSVAESKAGDSPGSDQPLRISSARRLPSGVSAGSKPLGGSTMRVVCRCGVLGSVTPERSARPYSPFSISCRPISPRPEAAAIRCLCSSSVHHALFALQGGPPKRVALAHLSSGMPAACIMFKLAWRSGSPHGVLGWTQPFGVSMKWLASLGGPRIDWPCAVTTRIAAAAAQKSAMRIVRRIRYIVTPKRAREALKYHLHAQIRAVRRVGGGPVCRRDRRWGPSAALHNLDSLQRRRPFIAIFGTQSDQQVERVPPPGSL